MPARRLPDGAGGERLIDETDLPANMRALLDKAPAAYTANRAYLALGNPAAAQNAQVQRLTRQVNALWRVLLGQTDDLSDT